MRRLLGRRSAGPVTFALLQVDDDPELWREQMAASLEACARGPPLAPDRGPPHRDLVRAPHHPVPVLADFPAYAGIAACHFRSCL